MNQFKRVSEKEYKKTFENGFKDKNGVLEYQSYAELKVPCRATRGSAGYDFFSPVSFRLKPGESMVVPTCIKCSLNLGRFLMIVPRSSYGFKCRMQIDNTIGIINTDYYNNASNEGHIFIKITNDSKSGEVLSVNAGDAFAQGIIMNFEIVDDDSAISFRTGGIGSTLN